MQKLYENFLHETFYTRSNYSNRAVIYVNHTKIFLHENFYHKKSLHENKANYGMYISARKVLMKNFMYECGLLPWRLNACKAKQV